MYSILKSKERVNFMMELIDLVTTYVLTKLEDCADGNVRVR